MPLIKTKTNYQWDKKQSQIEGEEEKDIDSLIRQLQLFVKDVRDDIFQLNTTLFTTLPTAEKDKRGSFVIKEASSVEDLLNICIRDASAAFLFKKIALNVNKKGADVDSTGSMTLGNDGDYFDIAGTTGITSITIRPEGDEVTLQFDGILTVTDGGNLKLDGDFVTAAESTLKLRSDGTNWIEVSRSPGTGDVTASSNITDNRIVRGDGGSKGIQESTAVISDAGEMTNTSQPAFLANPSSTQSNIAINTDVTILLGTEIFDQNNDFASNTFTAPVTGKYQLSFAIYLLQMDSAATQYHLRIVTSNRTYSVRFDGVTLSSDGTHSFTMSLLADMDNDDTAFLQFRQVGGTQQTDIDSGDTEFSGYLVA